MMPDDPLFDRIMWNIIRFVFLPAMLLMGLAVIVLCAIGLVELVSHG